MVLNEEFRRANVDPDEIDEPLDDKVLKNTLDRRVTLILTLYTHASFLYFDVNMLLR